MPLPHFTPRELTILRAMLNQQYRTLKDMAYELGITPGTLKVYMSRIYDNLGWPGGGSSRLLVLWVMEHQHELWPRAVMITTGAWRRDGATP